MAMVAEVRNVPFEKVIASDKAKTFALIPKYWSIWLHRLPRRRQNVSGNKLKPNMPMAINPTETCAKFVKSLVIYELVLVFETVQKAAHATVDQMGVLKDTSTAFVVTGSIHAMNSISIPIIWIQRPTLHKWAGI